MDNFKPNHFDRSIPGESWSAPKGSFNFQHPPQFTDPNLALEHTFDILTSPKAATQLKVLLEKGAPAEAIARNLLFAGFSTGKWTPDTAHIMAPIVQAQVVAVAHKMGTKNIKFSNPDKDYEEFMKKDLIRRESKQAVSDIDEDVKGRGMTSDMEVAKTTKTPTFGGLI